MGKHYFEKNKDWRQLMLRSIESKAYAMSFGKSIDDLEYRHKVLEEVMAMVEAFGNAQYQAGRVSVMNEVLRKIDKIN